MIFDTNMHQRNGEIHAAWTGGDVVSPVQCRMARAALQIGLRELASMARTSPKTLCKFENGTDIHPAIKRTVRTALEQAGAMFISPSPEHQGGVCLKVL